MASLFTKIMSGEIPGHFIYEDEVCVAILDKFPAVPGQTLVIPRQETDYVCDLDDEIYLHICLVAKHIAETLDATLETERTCFVIEGFEISHVHIKLYPVADTSATLGQLLPTGKEADDTELATLAKSLRENIEPLTEQLI